MKRLSKSAQRTKEYNDNQIARAVNYTAFLQIGPCESYRRECNTKEEAFKAACELNKLSLYGRQAIVYAITPEGFTVPIEA